MRNGEPMRIITRLLLSLVMAAAACCAQAADQKNADDMNAGIIYGDGHAFAVSAPDGWVLDNESGVNQGLHAVFYPKGSSWKEAPAVMYVNTVRTSPGETIESTIAGDLAEMKLKSPNIRMITGLSIATSDKKTAMVRYFTGDKWGNYEAVAYVQEETVFVLLTLTARTKELYENALNAFQNLVKSYAFLTKDVRFAK
jgi:hypothetical protein